MGRATPENSNEATLDRILGYLNFSSGNHDVNFFKNLDQVFSQHSFPDLLLSELLDASEHHVGRSNKRSNAETSIEQLLDKNDPFESQLFDVAAENVPAWTVVYVTLRDRLDFLAESNETFREPEQAREVLHFVFEQLLPGWLKFHRDLLFHQRTDFLFNSFFVARAMELTLQLNDVPAAKKLKAVLGQLNDHLGHRPIASLESQQIEPYQHEWIRPIPVYVRDAGAAVGPYQRIVARAVELIGDTSEDILRAARFDLDKLDELAIDPKAFDFDHPINKRPNHHFGTWDEQCIGPDGYYRRFIIHQVTLDGLLQRVTKGVESESIPVEELETEASAVLACTMLMASAISGDFVGAWDSETTLGTLLPVIAAYRDRFYEDLLGRLPARHRDRLREEALQRHQPLGAARQSLNATLSQRRASQLVNCRLASIFARMGFPVAAQMQLETVPVASARIVCRIDCLLAASFQAIDLGNLEGALKAAQRMVELLKRGIECGAIVDPWNIIGFDANYSLFPALENSVRDHRAFELVDIVESILALYSRLWSQAAGEDQTEMSVRVRTEFLSVVEWWRKYAAHEVMSVDAVDPLEVFDAAELVSTALNFWHKGGAETGDLQFWAKHAQLFDSPKAYKLVIDALMQREDYKTSTSLLIHWLSQSSSVGLQQGASSFHDLMFRWIAEQKRSLLERLEDAKLTNSSALIGKTWTEISKFYDFLEANAEQYWEVPNFELNRTDNGNAGLADALRDPDDPLDDSDGDGEKYDLGITYVDSANDGFEGEIHDGGGYAESDETLTAEIDRVLNRLEFLGNLASYWRIAATIPLSSSAEPLTVGKVDAADKDRLDRRRDTARSWVRQAAINRTRLLSLLDSVNAYRLPDTLGDQESMMVYDQHRLFKESLLEQTIKTCVETENAIRSLQAVIVAIGLLLGDEEEFDGQFIDEDSSVDLVPLVNTLAGFVMQNPDHIADSFYDLVKYFENQPILYVPLTRGGNPRSIVAVRLVQTNMLELLQTLPSIGMFTETYVLTQAVLHMEQRNPVALGAVTEFDELFKVAYTSMVSALADATEAGRADNDGEAEEGTLFACLRELTESMLFLWLEHSKTLRLSVLEKVHDKPRWQALVDFVEKYGDGLLTQYFLHLGNVRGILHQGVDQWIEQIETSGELEHLKLFRDLDVGAISRPSVVVHLTMILEAVFENFTEYRDYNTTTTQSDHGDKLYILLDFLRLRSRYDRVRWKMKPVVWAHKILVDKKQNNVARMWRRELNKKISPKAEKYVESLHGLRKKYSIQLESVGRRIEGKFESQIQIDRLIALVQPAVSKPRTHESLKAFDLLQHEAQAFCKTTTGVGIDLPPWLAALEHEVEQNQLPARLRLKTSATDWRCIYVPNIRSLQEQLEELPRKNED
jgi:hypothetical protein